MKTRKQKDLDARQAFVKALLSLAGAGYDVEVMTPEIRKFAQACFEFTESLKEQSHD